MAVYLQDNEKEIKMLSRLRNRFAGLAENFTPKLFEILKHGYDRQKFRRDMIAGATVAVVSIPLSMALAIASGVTPAQGLYTAIIAGFLIALLGGSRYQIGGPTGAFVVIIFNVIHQFGYAGLATAMLIAGVVLIAAGLLRLGTYIKYIPYPVVIGFTAGIGILLMSTQIKDLLGLQIEGVPADFLPKWRTYLANMDKLSLSSVAIAVVSFATIFYINFKKPQLPAYLISVIVSMVLVAVFSIAGTDVATIGNKFGGIPHFLPAPQMPDFNLDFALKVLPSGLTIAFLAGVESLLSATVVDGMSGDNHNSNAELVGEGVANLACVLFMGVPAIGIMLRNLFVKKAKDGSEREPSAAVTNGAVALACVIGLAVPLQMVSQTWDDHDRSGRYTTRDFGFNYLSSVDPDAIIFTNGDNDTFPLWYAQEVENFRPDVRVVNLSYLTTDWYANQMQYPTSEGKAIDMLATPDDYAYEKLAYSFVIPRQSGKNDESTSFGFVKNREGLTPALKSLEELYTSDRGTYGVPILSSPNIYLGVDSAAAMARYSSGNAAIDSAFIAPYVTDIVTDLSKNGSGLNQSKVLSLDMVANSVAGNWSRPVYFATTVPTSYYLGMGDFLSATGMAYEVTPFRDPDYNVTAEKGYRNVVGKFRWGGLDAPDAKGLYLDETVRRMVSSMRSGIYTIVENLMMTPGLPASDESRRVASENGLDEPQTHADMARQLLDIMEAKMPGDVSLYDGMLGLYFARTYLDLYLLQGKVEDLEKAAALSGREADRYAQLVKYATTLDPTSFNQLGRSETYALQYLGEALALLNRAELFAARPEIATAPEYAELRRDLASLDLESDLRIAPLLFINQYNYDELASEVDKMSPYQQKVVRNALTVLKANSEAGTDAAAFANELMNKYGFTPQEWDYVLN